MAHRRTGYRTKSGAVKVQVLLHPKEFAALAQDARAGSQGPMLPKVPPRSVSLVARDIIAFHYHYPAGKIKRMYAGKKYQPRGFAKA